MSDNTNATYVATDADDDPTLWLRNGNYPEALISRDGLRVAMRSNPFDPAAIAHVDRLWDAIAATAGEAPQDDDEPTPEQVEAASAPEWARLDASNAESDAIRALVVEVARRVWEATDSPGGKVRPILHDFAARVLEVRGQQPGVPVANREAVARAIEQGASDVDLAKYFLPGTTDRFVAAVLAADVFRDEAASAPGVPVEKVREVVAGLRRWASQEGRLVTSAYAYKRAADYVAGELLSKEPTS